MLKSTKRQQAIANALQRAIDDAAVGGGECDVLTLAVIADLARDRYEEYDRKQKGLT